MNATPYPWQARAWQDLNDLAEGQRLPHALMLCGPAEIGKLDFARAFAQRMLCASPLETLPCGQCKQCQLFKAGSHPDFLLLQPEEAGKAIKVDDVRAVADFAGKTAGQGGWRVIVVTPVEAMNINAASAFLKTLEEPGRKVLILVVSHQAGAVLPTIRSRCRMLAFPVPEQALSSQWLQQMVPDSDDVETALNLAAGKPLRARRLLESDLLQRYEAFHDLVQNMEKNRISPLDGAKLLDMLSHAEMVEALQGHVYKKLRSGELMGNNRSEVVFRFLDKLGLVKKRLQSTANPNPQLLWEEVLMDWKTVVDWLGANVNLSDR